MHTRMSPTALQWKQWKDGSIEYNNQYEIVETENQSEEKVLSDLYDRYASCAHKQGHLLRRRHQRVLSKKKYFQKRESSGVAAREPAQAHLQSPSRATGRATGHKDGRPLVFLHDADAADWFAYAL